MQSLSLNLLFPGVKAHGAAVQLKRLPQSIRSKQRKSGLWFKVYGKSLETKSMSSVAAPGIDKERFDLMPNESWQQKRTSRSCASKTRKGKLVRTE